MQRRTNHGLKCVDTRVYLRHSGERSSANERSLLTRRFLCPPSANKSTTANELLSLNCRNITTSSFDVAVNEQLGNRRSNLIKNASSESKINNRRLTRDGGRLTEEPMRINS